MNPYKRAPRLMRILAFIAVVVIACLSVYNYTERLGQESKQTERTRVEVANQIQENTRKSLVESCRRGNQIRRMQLRAAEADLRQAKILVEVTNDTAMLAEDKRALRKNVKTYSKVKNKIRIIDCSEVSEKNKQRQEAVRERQDG